MEIQQVLEELGMNSIEVKVYLYLLRHGTLSQQQISDNTKILRQTVYEVMNKMESGGFVSTSIIGKRKFYNAVDPLMLLKKIEEKKEDFLQILPNLSKMKLDSAISISSESFIGLAGLKNLFNMTLSSNSEILWFFNGEAHAEIFKDYYWDNYAIKRVKSKIPIKLLVEKEYNVSNWKSSKKDFRETRISNILSKIGHSAFVVFDDKVILYSFKKESLFGSFIQNSSLSEMFRVIFMDYWQKGKEL